MAHKQNVGCEQPACHSHSTLRSSPISGKTAFKSLVKFKIVVVQPAATYGQHHSSCDRHTLSVTKIQLVPQPGTLHICLAALALLLPGIWQQVASDSTVRPGLLLNSAMHSRRDAAITKLAHFVHMLLPPAPPQPLSVYSTRASVTGTAAEDQGVSPPPHAPVHL